MSPGVMITTAVSVIGSKVISRSLGNTETFSKTLPGCGSSVMVANQSGNGSAGEHAPTGTSTVPLCPAMVNPASPLSDPVGLSSLQISIMPAWAGPPKPPKRTALHKNL